MSKTATASKERKLAFKLFRALANGQDTIIPSTHRLRVNLVIEPLGIGLFSLSFRSFFLATIDYFVIDLWLSAAKVDKNKIPSKFFEHFFSQLCNEKREPWFWFPLILSQHNRSLTHATGGSQCGQRSSSSCYQHSEDSLPKSFLFHGIEAPLNSPWRVDLTNGAWVSRLNKAPFLPSI